VDVGGVTPARKFAASGRIGTMNTSIVCLPGNAPFLCLKVTDWPGVPGFLLIASPRATHAGSL